MMGGFESLFEVEESKPHWEALQERHGIICTEIPPDDPEGEIRHRAIYVDDDFQAGLTHDDKRSAIVGIIHRLRLRGWQEVSI